MTARASLILFAAILALPAAGAADLRERTQNGAVYVSGGVGDEERHALEAMSQRFNLKLTMALKDGHFLGDTTVRIQDAQGEAVVDTIADGPLFYAQLKPGTYTVTCGLSGKLLTKTAHITNGQQQQLEFTWSSE